MLERACKMRRVSLLAGLMTLLTAFGAVGGSNASASNGQGTATTASSSTNTQRASIADAKRAALFHVVNDAKTNESEWKGGKISLSPGVLVNDPAGQELGYLFYVSIGERPAGYVLVSTDLDEFPIVEFAYSGVPLPEQRIAALKQEAGKPISGHQLVYDGGVRFMVNLKYADGTQDLIEPRRGTKLKDYGFQKVRPAHPAEARRFRDSVNTDVSIMEIGNDSDGVTDVDPENATLGWEKNWTSARYYEMSGVPAWDQWTYYKDAQGRNYWTGCAPTAAADIMEYWKNHGYPNMAVTTNSQVVFDLRTAMGTTNPCGTTDCAGSTSIDNVSPGMQSYARGRGYNNATATKVIESSFATVTNAIGSPGPVLLTIKEQTFYNNGLKNGNSHTVTAYGYREYTYPAGSTGHQYVIIHDNWDTTASRVFMAYGRNYTPPMLIHTFRPS